MVKFAIHCQDRPNGLCYSINNVLPYNMLNSPLPKAGNMEKIIQKNRTTFSTKLLMLHVHLHKMIRGMEILSYSFEQSHWLWQCTRILACIEIFLFKGCKWIVPGVIIQWFRNILFTIFWLSCILCAVASHYCLCDIIKRIIFILSVWF